MNEQEKLDKIKKLVQEKLANGQAPKATRVAPVCPVDPAERAACDSCQ